MHQALLQARHAVLRLQRGEAPTSLQQSSRMMTMIGDDDDGDDDHDDDDHDDDDDDQYDDDNDR